MENETFWQCDHIWVWVDNGNVMIPYDWGYLALVTDAQHLFRYVIRYRDLLKEALRD